MMYIMFYFGAKIHL